MILLLIYLKDTYFDGLDQLNYNVTNDAGAFTSSVKEESGKLILTTEKIYKQQHSDKFGLEKLY